VFGHRQELESKPALARPLGLRPSCFGQGSQSGPSRSTELPFGLPRWLSPCSHPLFHAGPNIRQALGAQSSFPGGWGSGLNRSAQQLAELFLQRLDLLLEIGCFAELLWCCVYRRVESVAGSWTKIKPWKMGEQRTPPSALRHARVFDLEPQAADPTRVAADFGRAVSRILSAPNTRRRESFVSAANTRNPFRCAERGAGRSEVPYLALHPMGFSVPPRLRLERWALTPPFHPYPALVAEAGAV